MEAEVGGDLGVDDGQDEYREQELRHGDHDGVSCLEGPGGPPLDAGLVEDEITRGHDIHLLVHEQRDHQDEGEAPDRRDRGGDRAASGPAHRPARRLHDCEVPATNKGKGRVIYF